MVRWKHRLRLLLSPHVRRVACYVFLAAHPVLVASAALPPPSTALGTVAARLLAYYSSLFLPRCLYAAVLASLPPVSGLLQHLLGFAELPGFESSQGDGREQQPLEGMADMLDAPVLYGLQHTVLNLRVDGYWLNMGYWKNANSFAEACAALTNKVAEAAQVRVGDKVLDVGYGCGDQDIYLHNHYNTEEIIGLTCEPVQARLARRRVRDLGLQSRIRLYLGDAARLSEFVARSGLISESYMFDRILAIDSAYHFNTREKFLREAFRHLRPNGRLALTDILPSSIREPSSDHLMRAACAMTDIPLENLAMAPTEYRQMLASIGYEDIQMEFLEDDVLPGLARYIDAQKALLGSVLSSSACLRLAAVGCALRNLHSSGNWHFILVSARKPYERL